MFFVSGEYQISGMLIYIYLNGIDNKPRSYHEIFIHNIIPDITVITRSVILRKNLINIVNSN